MTYETITVERQDGITTVTLNRPEKRNAMSPQMHREMSAVLEELELDDETRVLVITGAGDAFCAGQDLDKYFHDHKDKPREMERIRKLSNEWRGAKLRLFPKPTIAAVNGWCFGGAFTTVAACDLAVAAEEAIFGLSEINFGVFPGGLVTKAVTDLLRTRDALYYILTGDQFDGRRAAEIGLVNYAVPRQQLMAEVHGLARKLAEKNPLSLKAAKEVYKLGKSMGWDEAFAWAIAKINELTLLQKGEWMEQGVGQFRGKQYKPGLGAYKKKG
ncbi:MAG: p-hydroxycinnamoyl CoA hydratase/lyase [Deltaproteobacteria bacterium]|nr:p-hydroxycinnamoyl CoA hydratase/lyase [Deltaproteobacteria bacterium]